MTVGFEDEGSQEPREAADSRSSKSKGADSPFELSEGMQVCQPLEVSPISDF